MTTRASLDREAANAERARWSDLNDARRFARNSAFRSRETQRHAERCVTPEAMDACAKAAAMRDADAESLRQAWLAWGVSAGIVEIPVADGVTE